VVFGWNAAAGLSPLTQRIRPVEDSRSDLGKERPDGYSPGRFAGGEICERCRIVRGKSWRIFAPNMDAGARKSSGSSALGDEFSFRFGPVTTALLADRIDEACLRPNSQ